MLESYVRERLREKEILLMTHIVLGYPSLEDSFRIVETMVEAGVDLMELQIPFSEPVADGPVILRANQEALRKGVKVKDCLACAGRIAGAFPIPFLVVSYYNIPFRYGVRSFAAAMADLGLSGAIFPDLPPEEGEEVLEAMCRHGLSPILLFSPSTPAERMRHLAEIGRGFIYCVARKGVTGGETPFSEDLSRYLARCRQATTLPLAVGFGLSRGSDVEFLKGKADIAVVGSEVIRLMDRDGLSSVGPFLRALQPGFRS
ncbi:MAG: tryptophan synthase subunit alpha [Thermodesulfobacteriota bacterium]